MKNNTSSHTTSSFASSSTSSSIPSTSTPTAKDNLVTISLDNLQSNKTFATTLNNSDVNKHSAEKSSQKHTKDDSNTPRKDKVGICMYVYIFN